MKDQKLLLLVNWIYRLTIGLLVAVIFLSIATFSYVADPSLSFLQKNESEQNETLALTSNEAEVENGVHVATGLKEGEGMMLVVQNCTACHSAKLITQNRADEDGWRSMIKWMQATQNLWDLGENEDKIVSYLAKNYPPGKSSRRAPLQNIEWYELED